LHSHRANLIAKIAREVFADRRVAFAASFLALLSTQAVPQEMKVVTILLQDKVAIDAKIVPVKEVVSHLSGLYAGKKPGTMILIRNCEKVSPDAIRGVTDELQKSKTFTVVLDSNPPEPGVCAR
jgi:biopolymer transport protein ExbD